MLLITLILHLLAKKISAIIDAVKPFVKYVLDVTAAVLKLWMILTNTYWLILNLINKLSNPISVGDDHVITFVDFFLRHLLQ